MIPWIDIESEIPDLGERVLIYGYVAPDGPRVVEVDTLRYVSPNGTPFWNRLDVVTHWVRLADLDDPEESAYQGTLETKIEKLTKALHLALWAPNLRERNARNSALREARTLMEEVK